MGNAVSGTPNLLPRLTRDADSQPIQLLGYRPGTMIGTNNSLVHHLTANTGLAPNTAATFDFTVSVPNRTIVRLMFYDHADPVAGTPENFFIVPGIAGVTISAADAAMATTTKPLFPISKMSWIDVPLKDGQTSIAVRSLSTGAKTHDIFAIVLV